MATVCDDAGFVRTVSVGQFFMTRSELDRNTFGNSSVCREYRHSRDHPAAYTKGSIGVNTRFGRALEVIATKMHDMVRVDVNIDAMVRDGTESLMLCIFGS